MNIETDVLIVGTGVSALYCALNLKKNLKILMITKSSIRETNSYLAQGGISTALNLEDIPLFVEDTLKAGRYKNVENSVEILAKQSMDNIKKLVSLGVPFDKRDGGLAFTREGAHSINRIVHCWDKTGEVVSETLISQVLKRDNITILENCTLLDIVESKGKCIGAVVYNDEVLKNIHCKVTVFATGGIGGLFKNSTNQRIMTGDGVSIASKHNVKLKDINYIQFHPTALYDGESNSRRFLISEAVRGEGALLTNSKGKRFIDELLPRDVVADAINKEILESGVPYVNLDISFKDADFLKKRFPLIYSYCLEKGIDITKEPIPVSPAQHYFMGGIEVDTNSQTSLKNLYAVGECSCTGVHGANRLASNSLLEALVFSRRASININDSINNTELVTSEDKFSFSLGDFETSITDTIKRELQIRWDKYDDELFCH